MGKYEKSEQRNEKKIRSKMGESKSPKNNHNEIKNIWQNNITIQKRESNKRHFNINNFVNKIDVTDLKSMIDNFQEKTCNLGSILKDDMFGFSVKFAQDLFCKKYSTKYVVYQFLINKKRFVVYQSKEKIGQNQETDDLKNFSIVLVSDDCISDFKKREKSLIHIGNIQAYLEEKDGFLSQDFESIQKVQHEFTNEIQSWNIDNLDAKSISEKIYKLYQKHEKKINQYKILTQYFECQNSNKVGTINITKNFEITVNQQNNDNVLNPILVNIMPHHSLAIHKKKFESKFSNVSTSFQEFVKFSTPFQSQYETSESLKIPVDVLKKYAGHLIYCNTAVLINKFTMRSNAYKLSDSQTFEKFVNSQLVNKTFKKNQVDYDIYDTLRSHYELTKIDLTEFFSKLKNIQEYFSKYDNTDQISKKNVIEMLEKMIYYRTLEEYEPHYFIDNVMERINEKLQVKNSDEFLENNTTSNILQYDIEPKSQDNLDQKIQPNFSIKKLFKKIKEEENSNLFEICHQLNYDIDQVVEEMTNNNSQNKDEFGVLHYVKKSIT